MAMPPRGAPAGSAAKRRLRTLLNRCERIWKLTRNCSERTVSKASRNLRPTTAHRASGVGHVSRPQPAAMNQSRLSAGGRIADGTWYARCRLTVSEVRMSSRRADVSDRLAHGGGDSSTQRCRRSAPSGELPGQAFEAPPPPKLMALRYAGTCSICRIALPAKQGRTGTATLTQ